MGASEWVEFDANVNGCMGRWGPKEEEQPQRQPLDGHFWDKHNGRRRSSSEDDGGGGVGDGGWGGGCGRGRGGEGWVVG